MKKANDPWYQPLLRPELWLEAFVIVNIAFLSLDIYLAHSVNAFRHRAEYIPLYFSLVAPLLLVIGLVCRERFGFESVWRDLGYLVGWLALFIGLVGTVLHLQSGVFQSHTIKSLVYAAPFAAPLSYTGLGLLLIMNRMTDSKSVEWALWVILMAMGGFFGNFVFCLTDHAQNGMYHVTEWIAVGTSALAVGTLLSIYCTPVTVKYLYLCAAVMLLQVCVGLLGFFLHARADLNGPADDMFSNFIYGAPSLAPLLFPNLTLLAGIGLYAFAKTLPSENQDGAQGEVQSKAQA